MPVFAKSQSKWMEWVALCGVVLLTAALHWPALHNQALFLDDDLYLRVNPLVNRPSWDSVRVFFGEVLDPSTVKGYYQPLSMTSLMIDAAAGGSVEHLEPFRRTSLFLHLANTVLLALFLRALFARPWVAAGLALLFGVHPISVEVIGWVGERKTVLATFFSLLCLIFYVWSVRDGAERRRRLWRALSVGGFGLALLAKPTSVPMPVLLLLLDWWPLRRFSRGVLMEKAPYIALGGLAAVITVASQASSAAVLLPGEVSWSRTLLTIPYAIVFYLREWVWPVGLTPHHPYPRPFDLSDPGVWAGLVGTAVIVAGVIWSLRATRAIFAGWMFFFAAIFPTLGVLGFTHVVVHDKYLYLPSVGFSLIAAWGCAWILARRSSVAVSPGMSGWSSRKVGRWMGRLRRAAPLLLGVLLVLLVVRMAVATRAYLPKWKDTETLYRHVLSLRPDAVAALDDLAGAYLREGRIEDALPLLERALALEPEFPNALNNAGVAAFRQGRVQDAKAYFERAVARHPGLHEARNNLGRAFAREGRFDDAVAQFEAVLADNPLQVEASANLARARRDLGEVAAAIEIYRKLLVLAPRHTEARLELAQVLSASGDVEGGIEVIREGMRIDPKEPVLPERLALLLVAEGRLVEGVAEFRAALALDGSRPVTHNNLGIAHARAGRPDSARACFAEAVRLDSTYVEARRNLERIEAELHR